MSKVIALGLVFALPLLYARYTSGKWHTSISAIYYDTKLRMLWKLTIMGMAYITSLYHEIVMDWAAVSILGVAIFPDINVPRIKRIHDSFAVIYFALVSYYIHPTLTLGLICAFALGYKLTTLYWLEWIGMGTLIIGLTLKELL